jgi:hypothetical protein
MQELFAALRDDPEGRNRLFGTFAGTVAPEDFFGERQAAA